MREERFDACRLLLGDCRTLLPTLPPVDVVITDPPYGVALRAKHTKHHVRQSSHLYADSEDGTLQLITDAMALWQPLTTRAVITCGIRLLQRYPPAASIGAIVCPNGAGRDRWGFGCHHPVLYYGSDPYTAAGLGGRPNSVVLSHPGMHVTREDHIDHPCPKPIMFLRWLVQRGSLPGQTVLDPFMGTGTTGVACVELGRAFVGIEIDPYFFDIACARIAEAQQQVPLLHEPVQARLFAR